MTARHKLDLTKAWNCAYKQFAADEEGAPLAAFFIKDLFRQASTDPYRKFNLRAFRKALLDSCAILTYDYSQEWGPMRIELSDVWGVLTVLSNGDADLDLDWKPILPDPEDFDDE